MSKIVAGDGSANIVALYEKVGQVNQPKLSITLLMSYYICSTYYVPSLVLIAYMEKPFHWFSGFYYGKNISSIAKPIIQNILFSIVAKAINRKVSSQEFLVFIINYALLSVFCYMRTVTQIQYYKGMNLS